jgi:hypothetical protein
MSIINAIHENIGLFVAIAIIAVVIAVAAVIIALIAVK